MVSMILMILSFLDGPVPSVQESGLVPQVIYFAEQPGDRFGETIAVVGDMDGDGYSDIAIGTARLFGFNLMRNFAFPYFSRDIAEFWRRWHISLSSWFRDYVYIPLGGSKVGKWAVIRNIFIIFVVSGFWHGANWTFIAWGFLNAVYFLPLMLFKQNRKNLGDAAEGRLLPTFREFIQINVTFLLTTLAWIFFRADSIQHAFSYLGGIFSMSLFTLPETRPKFLFVLILIFLAVEWLQRSKQHALEFDTIRLPGFARWAIYYLVVIVIFYYGGEKQDFIYFQF